MLALVVLMLTSGHVVGRLLLPQPASKGLLSTIIWYFSHYSVVRNFVCGGHVEQKHCKATGPPEKRHPKFSASSKVVASACWGASSLGCRSMGQENLQVILAAERRQKRHQSDTLSDTQTCLSKAPAHSVL